MADAKITKIGMDAAVALEVAAKAPAAAEAAPTNVDPADERRVVGVTEYKAPNGTITVVTNL